MFKKPFKLRSQNQLKNTEKKRFGNDLKILFPSLTDNDISTLLSNKENVVRLKVTTFKEEDVDIYCINKTPIYIDIVDSGIKLPTVFMTWRLSHILPTFTTSTKVLDNLKNGSDLFFPGIYAEGLISCDTDFKKNDVVGINLIDNKAIVAVGLALVNKSDVMDQNKSKDIGKLVKVYHTVEDHLFNMKANSTVLQLGPPDWAVPITEDSISNVNSEGTENNEKDVQGKNNEEVQNLSQTETKDSKTSEEKNVENSGTEPEKESFDELLEYCFLKALKTIPKNCYPILPATFYAKYILANVPEGKIINLKKTKWKKFNVFLQEKSLEGLIKLQPMPKNEFTIAEANTDHQKVKRFVDPYKVITVEVESKNNKPIVQQIYSVSAVTLPFFSKFGLKKHDELTRNEVRDYVNDYIKTENLVDPNKPEFVILDPVLFQILKGEEVISRANLLIELLQKMSVQHKISNCGNGKTILHKGKMPLIEFETCLRTGNKKVTLISNLESYGVNVSNFSKELQHKAAASTTIIPTVPGKKGPQIQVQGNQVAVAFAILKEKHNLSEKSMKGLEKAVKPKNKK